MLEDAFATRIYTPSFYDPKGSIWEDWSWEKWSGAPRTGFAASCSRILTSSGCAGWKDERPASADYRKALMHDLVLLVLLV